MNIDEMDCEEKLEYYQRQTNQLKKRRDDAISKINYLNNYIKALHQDIKDLKKENEKLKQAYNDAKKDVEKKEQILKDIMDDNFDW